MLENTVPVDPEEESEKKLVRSMAMAIMAIIVGGIIVLALRPWIQRFRERNSMVRSVDFSLPGEQ